MYGDLTPFYAFADHRNYPFLVFALTLCNMIAKSTTDSDYKQTTENKQNDDI